MTAAGRNQSSEDLSAYLDGELSPERAKEIERALKEHPELRAELEQLRAVSQQLRHLPRMHAPQALNAALRGVAARGAPTGAGRGRTLRLYVRLAAVAAVLVGCVFVGWRIRIGERSPERSAVSANAPDKLADEMYGRESRGMDSLRQMAHPDAVGKPLATGKPPGMASPPAGEATAPAVVSAEVPSAPMTVAEPGEIVVLGHSADLPEFADKAALPGLELPPREGIELTYVARLAVDVCVRPQNAKQYRAAYAVLTQAGMQRQALDSHARVAEMPDVGGQEAVSVVWAVPTTEVPALVAELERQAPGEVTVETKGAPAALRQELAYASPERLHVLVHPQGADQRAAGEVTTPPASAAVAVTDSADRDAARPAAKKKETSKEPAPATATVRTGRAQKQEPAAPQVARSEVRRMGGGGAAGAAKDAKAQPARTSEQKERRKAESAAQQDVAREGEAALPNEAAEAGPAPSGARRPEFVQTVIVGLKWFAERLPPARPEPVWIRIRLLPPSAPIRPATTPSRP